MRTVEISVICPVTEAAKDLATAHREFRDALARTGRPFEFLYVFDGPWVGGTDPIGQIRQDNVPVRVLRLSKGFGEATALQVGFEHAAGDYVLTIPDRPQIDPNVVTEILGKLDAGEQVVVTRREPRSDVWFNQFQSWVFHGLIRRLVGHNFHDMTCGVRGFRREAAVRLELYGDQHRFIPVIALRLGYRVVEIPGRQHRSNESLRLYRPGVYLRRLLDILNIYFLTRFTRKPLRFFGLIGVSIGSIGLVICVVLAIQRLMLISGLANRPLLLLGVLLLVLGVQVTSIGLLGEIIIFLSSRRDTPMVREIDSPSARSEPPATAIRADS